MKIAEAKKIAFVAPRYGQGGAEAVLAEAARGLQKRGYSVEILTTCAENHYTWENAYPQGVAIEDNISVRRFLTEVTTDGTHRERIGGRILNGEYVSISDQQLWVNDSVRCSGLWDYVKQNHDDYRCLIFAPYMFWTTFAVSQICPEKSIIMPCLHDEPPAYLELFKPMINEAKGIWFLTDPEAELAAKIFDLPQNNQVVGAGVDVPATYDVEAFRKKYSISQSYIFYAGRREWGKGWGDLTEAFRRVVAAGPSDLLLVTSGVGDMGVPDDMSHRVVDIGYVPEDDRNAAMAGALAYAQPSAMESFSRSIMEAWLAGTPVIANAKSNVVRWHVDRSQAGVCYRNIEEFAEAMLLLASNPTSAEKLAEPGRRYVLDNYQWDLVEDRMQASIEQWFPLSSVKINRVKEAVAK